MDNNQVPWPAGDDRERCTYCGFYVRSPMFFFPPGTYKFQISNMAHRMYVMALTSTTTEQLLYLDFGNSLEKNKKTVTLVVETGDYYRFTSSTDASAVQPGAGIHIWQFMGDVTAWEEVAQTGWAEPNVTLSATRDVLTCDFDDFTAPDCSTAVTVSNSGPVPANVTFATTRGTFSFSQQTLVVPADQGQLTATATASVSGLAPGFYDDRLVLMTQETQSCRGEGVAFNKELIDGYRCERLVANVTLGVSATGELAFLQPAAAWNCSIGPGSTFCPDIQLSLTNPGNASLAWMAIFDGQNINVTPNRGEIAPRATTVATVDVQEARFPPGQHLETVEILTSALRHHCGPPGELLGPDATAAPASHENFTCSSQTVPVGIDVGLTSGLVAYPSVLQIDLPLDQTRYASVSAMYVEVNNSVPYRVDMDPACGAGLALAETSSAADSGAPKTLVRLVPDQIDFRLEGLADVAAFNFNGTVAACTANIVRLDNEARQLPLLFNVTARPGPPSAASTLAASPASPMAGSPAELTLQGVDRLGHECDRVWEDVQTRFVAVNAAEEETDLGVGIPLSGDEAGNFELALGALPVPPGSYHIRGYLGADGAAETRLTQEQAIEVVPIECPQHGESAARTGLACECDAGFGGDASSPNGCSSCPEGSYKKGAGNFACISCPGGSTTREAQSTSATQCLCPRGSFLSGDDGVSVGCTPCVAALGEGASTADMGALSVDECQCEPIYFRDKEGKCVPCPFGARCDGSFADSMKLETGFWRSSRESSTIHACHAPRGVPLCEGGKISEAGAFEEMLVEGGAVPSDDLCRPGHKGALCWECLLGYGKRLGVCERCSGNGGAVGQSVAFVILGSLLFLVAILGLTSQTLGRIMQETPNSDGHDSAGRASFPMGGIDLEEEEEGARKSVRSDNSNITVGVIKVLVTWLQLASLANSVRVDKGPEMSELLKWEDLGNVSPWSFASFNCAVPVGFYSKFYATTLVPLACVPIGALVTLLVARLAEYRRWVHRFAPADVFTMTVQLLLFLSYTMVNNVTMSVFKCQELDEGLAVLAADPSVVCGTPAHASAVGVGVASIVLLTIGVPLQAFIFMWLNRNNLQSERMKVRFGFFFQNYRPEVYWYECFSLVRKAAIVATVVLLQDNVGLQVFTVSLVALIFLSMHTYHKPYHQPLLNVLESLALFVSNMTLSFCTFSYVTRQAGKEERGYEQFLSWVVILLSLGFLGLCLLVIAADVARHAQKKRGSSKTKNSGEASSGRRATFLGDGRIAKRVELVLLGESAQGTSGGELRCRACGCGELWCRACGEVVSGGGGGTSGLRRRTAVGRNLLGSISGATPMEDQRGRSSVLNPLQAPVPLEPGSAGGPGGRDEAPGGEGGHRVTEPGERAEGGATGICNGGGWADGEGRKSSRSSMSNPLFT